LVSSMVRTAVGEPVVVHSTSWRRSRQAVILSFVAVVDATAVGTLDSVPVPRAELARNSATAAPTSIAWVQVLEHGLRHVAWLLRDDPVVAQRLADGWPQALADYVPEPFRNLR